MSGPREMDAEDLARSIQRMTLMVRGEAGKSPVPRPAGADGVASADGIAASDGLDGAAGSVRHGLGWWVLAQGGQLAEGDFSAREAARDLLLAQVRRAGLLVAENVWVWDETGNAQLVLATLPTEDRAQRLAERLRDKGISVRVRREMP